MKKNIIIWGTGLLLVLMAFFVTTNYGKNSSSNQTDSTARASVNTTYGLINEKAIDFTLKNLNGKEVSLSDFRGKNVYVNFFATWCPPCRAEMPDIEKMYQKYKDNDFVVLAVDLGEYSDTVKSFFETNNLNFPTVLDSDQMVASQYNISAIPVSIFIDKQGNIVAKKVGAMTGGEMELYIKMLIDKK